MWETQVPSLGWTIAWRKAWQPTPVGCLENPTDRGAWRATVHGVAKSRTRLSDSHTHTVTQGGPGTPVWVWPRDPDSPSGWGHWHGRGWGKGRAALPLPASSSFSAWDARDSTLSHFVLTCAEALSFLDSSWCLEKVCFFPPLFFPFLSFISLVYLPCFINTHENTPQRYWGCKCTLESNKRKAMHLKIKFGTTETIIQTPKLLKVFRNVFGKMFPYYLPLIMSTFLQRWHSR